MKRMKIAVLSWIFSALFLPCVLFASSQGFYNFENNLNDSPGTLHGSAVGDGPTYVTFSPVPLVGSYCAGGWNDSNYATIPTTIFDNMKTTGTIKQSVFVPYNAPVTVSLGSNNGVYGHFSIYWQAVGTFYVGVPTDAGYQAFSNSYAWKQGQWYTVYVTYAPGALKVYIRDALTNTLTLVIDQAVNCNFDSCSLVAVGRDATVGGYSFSGGYIDNVEFYNTVTTTETQATKEERIFLSFGHSWVLGTLSANGDRAASFGYWGGLLGLNYYHLGQTIWGNIICPWTDAIGGSTIADTVTQILAVLAADLPFVSDKVGIFLGPIEINDCRYGTSLTDYKTSFLAALDAIYAFSPYIRIYVVTGFLTDEMDISAYIAKTKEAANDRIAAGRNILIIDGGNQSIPLDYDGQHPTADGYTTLGIFKAQAVNNDLNTTPTYTPTFTVTPTATPTRTITATPTATNTPIPTPDPARRYFIYDSQRKSFIYDSTRRKLRK